MDNRYSWQQVCFHWLSAIIIIWGTLSGFFVFFTQPAAEIKQAVGFVNVSLTTLFIPFFILRVYYFIAHGKPAPSAAQVKSQKMFHAIHLIIYTNITVVLITGVLMMERPINVFNVISFPAPLTNPGLVAFFNSAHAISCGTLALLALLHVMAVVKHQLKGNGVMHRMTLPLSSSPQGECQSKR